MSAATRSTDAISIFYVDSFLPYHFEVVANVFADKATAGFQSNGFVILDYQDTTNFKFAGIDVGRDKVQIGRRASWGWQVLAEVQLQLLDNRTYEVLVRVEAVAICHSDVSYTDGEWGGEVEKCDQDRRAVIGQHRNQFGIHAAGGEVLRPVRVLVVGVAQERLHEAQPQRGIEVGEVTAAQHVAAEGLGVVRMSCSRCRRASVRKVGTVVACSGRETR